MPKVLGASGPSCDPRSSVKAAKPLRPNNHIVERRASPSSTRMSSESKNLLKTTDAYPRDSEKQRFRCDVSSRYHECTGIPGRQNTCAGVSGPDLNTPTPTPTPSLPSVGCSAAMADWSRPYRTDFASRRMLVSSSSGRSPSRTEAHADLCDPQAPHSHTHPHPVPTPLFGHLLAKASLLSVWRSLLLSPGGCPGTGRTVPSRIDSGASRCPRTGALQVAEVGWSPVGISIVWAAPRICWHSHKAASH